MLGLIIDSIPAANHGVLKYRGPPHKTDARSKVVLVGSEKRTPIGRSRRRDEVGQQNAVLPDVNDLVIVLSPALEIVVTHAEVKGQIVFRFPFLVDKVSLPPAEHVRTRRSRIHAGLFHISEKK